MKRFTSRKFIVALIAQIAGLIGLIWPQHAQGVMATADAITSMAVILLTGLGYMTVEAAVDRARAQNDATSIRTQTPAR